MFKYRLLPTLDLSYIQTMSFDWSFPYHSQRMPVLASNVVATSQPLAAQAGLYMLHEGGNAVDAAIAAAIALTVVEPVNTGIGGDAFAMVWDGSNLHGLNASGKSPADWSYDYFAGKYRAMPRFGWDSVTVPGTVSAWVQLSRKFGRLPFSMLFEPAIRYAYDGFPVSPKSAHLWDIATKTYTDFPEFRKTFLVNDKALATGQIFKCVDMARTLEKIADSGGETFYKGEIAEKIARNSQEMGGLMKYADLAGHLPMWVGPVVQPYRNLDIHELPPNGQGIAAQIALGIIEYFDLSKYPVDSTDSLHIQIEAMKLAFADIKAHLADPDFMQVGYQELLDRDYLKKLANLIDMKRASYPVSGIQPDRGTVYLTAADSSGMMVSYIQSNFWGFGSGIVIPGTGIAMQNRGSGFSLERGHPNQVDGSKRPYHTIIPGFISKDGRPVMSFGVMGGHFQPQGHVQMVTRIFDYKQNPQTACDAHRWMVTEDGKVAVEPGFGKATMIELSSRGHEIITDQPESIFGGAQLIYRLDNGSYLGASDPRKDGLAVGF